MKLAAWSLEWFHLPRTPRRKPRWSSLGGLAVTLLLCGTAPAWSVDPAVLEAERQRIETVARVAPTVVAIFTASGDGGGSGVLISPDGYALSNFHVTSGAGPFMKCGLNDGKLYDAVLVGIDPTGDVALIKLLGRDDFPAAVLGDSDQVRVGERVFAMGNPFLLATDFQPTLTFGMVSGVHRYQYPAGTILEYADCIQTDASINPGNSGGPLFNARGELIGINGRGSFEKRGRVNVGAGYAISINQIKHFLDHLRSGRIVDHATLGAVARTGYDRAVIVDRILENSSAYRRGLREGDEIVSFAGRPIGSVNQFKNVLGIYPDGWKVPLVYRRQGQKHEIVVELRRLHRASEFLEKPRAPQPPRPQPREKDKDQDRPQQPPPDAPPRELPLQPLAIPEQWKHLYEERPGFANYYFNRQEQTRVLKGLAEFGDYAAAKGRWRFSGATADGRPFEFTLAEAGLFLKLGKNAVYHQPRDIDPIDEPPGSGGLLTALEQFKVLLVRGPEGFSTCYYVGSEPLDGTGPLVDVLFTQQGTVRTEWYFDRLSGRFVGFDTALAEDVDPAEIRVLDLADFSGRRFLGQWTARAGEKEFATFQTTAIELLPESTP
jgi:serine protease Do